jgi:acetolactate synthase-1/2/3 large subunit
MTTAAMAFLDALTQAGVSHIFVNFGSDHPALIEAHPLSGSLIR